jgi:hypothetical protein
MKVHLLRLSLALAVVALLSSAGSVTAQGRVKKRMVIAPPSFATLVGELHQTRVLLQQANHDYDGYRAKAVHDLGQAMRALDPNHKHKLPPSSNPGAGEDQRFSDAQLNQAGKQVQIIMSQLATGAATPQTTSAMQHMQNALGHLSTALKIR